MRHTTAKADKYEARIYEYLTRPDNEGRPADIQRRRDDLLTIARNPSKFEVDDGQVLPPHVNAAECNILEARLTGATFEEIAEQTGFDRKTVSAICERKCEALYRFLEKVWCSKEWIAWGPEVEYEPPLDLSGAFERVGARMRRAYVGGAISNNMAQVRQAGLMRGHIDGGLPPDPGRDKALLGFIGKRLDAFEAGLWRAYLEGHKPGGKEFRGVVGGRYRRDNEALIEAWAHRIVELEAQFNQVHRAVSEAA